MRIYKIIVLFLALFLSSCGVQRATNNAEATARKSKVVKAHKQAVIDFKTIKSRLGVRYKDEKRSQSVTVDLRMKQGEKIWMSARVLGLTLAKVYITPDRVQFYEKINGRSFDGDFRLISDFLGEPLTFNQLEAVLLGQAVEDLSNYPFTIENNEYVFQSTGMIEKLFTMRPADFKLSQQSVRKDKENSFLEINYPDYQVVDGRILPREVNIEAKRGKRNSKLELEFKSVEFNKELSFPFSMPSNTKPINL